MARAEVDAIGAFYSRYPRTPRPWLIWRGAVAQHFASPGGHFNPLKDGTFETANLLQPHRRCSRHSREDMERHGINLQWNAAASSALSAAGIPAVHVWNSTVLAWNRHVDYGDCTHYCQAPGGVPDQWARALFRILSA